MRVRLGVLFAASVMVAFANVATNAQSTTMTWTVDGVKRQALVFPPAGGHKTGKAPLVFVFHGHGGNMNFAAQGMRFQNFWPEAITVYPQGLPTPSKVDPQGLRPGWQVEGGQLGDRDLKFVDAMLATMRQSYSVDDTRVYASGFSNGAIFSYLLWARRGKMLAALGICAGLLSASEHLTEPRAVVVVAGENDQVCPFALQQQTIQIDRQVDHATGQGQPCGPRCTLYPSAQNTPVMTRIHPGGHVYPPWAAAAIVEFFKTHTRP